MSFSHSHSFHDCPLRCSSLLIVNQEKQTIVTATDEVFDILGYDPMQLVGKSISILDPCRQKFKENGKKKERFTLRHESFGQIPFEICIHHDPLTNATDLDYWLIRPIHLSQTPKAVTILRLGPFGTIEHAYPSTQFPQQTHELKGHPIMSFVHESDVRSLCEKLCHIQRRVHHTFRIRWLSLFHPKEDPSEGDFEWVSLTIMNAPRRLSHDAANDPQSRPIIIIRPENNQISDQQKQFCISEWSTPYLLTGLVSGTIKLLWDGTSFGVNQVFEILGGLHRALDEGKTYMIEFIIHLLTHTLKIMDEVFYFSSLEEYKHMDDDRVHSIKKKSHSTHCNKKHHLHGLSAVKVSVNNSIWWVPLYIKKTIESSNHSLRSRQKTDIATA